MDDIERQVRDIIDRYSALIRKVIQGQLFPGDDVDLEDVEQEIRVRLWKSLAKGKKIEKLPSYIMKVAYTATVDELRRLRKQAPYRDTLHWGRMLQMMEGKSPEKAAARPERRLDQREKSRDLERSMEPLSPDRRRVLRLYVCGLSIEEICEMCGWDRTRVRHLLYRGIENLRDLATSKGSGTGNRKP